MLVRIGHIRDGYSSHAIPSGPADGLLITGAVSRNMKLAFRKTYDYVDPQSKLVMVNTAVHKQSVDLAAIRRMDALWSSLVRQLGG
jgi:Ni,Fe-hydrogenase III small subunit